MNPEAGMQIDLVGALRRQMALICTVGGLVFLVSFWVAMLLPNSYQSRVTMLVEPPSVSERLVEAGIAESDLNTRLNLMVAQILARPRLSRIIDEFGLYPELSAELTRAEVVEEMRSKIAIIPVEGALVPTDSLGLKPQEINTFQIIFTYEDAGIPPLVVQKLANNFIDKQLTERIEITQKSFEFIQAEEARLQLAIDRVQDKIREIKLKNPGELPENMQSNQRQLMTTMVDLRNAEQRLVEAISDESFWAQKSTSGIVPAGDGAMSSAGRLKALELSVSEYRAKGFTDKHPDIVKAKQEIAVIEAKIASERASSDRPMTFEQMSVAAERERAAKRGQAIRRQIEQLRASESEVQARTDRIPEVASALEGLDRQWQQLSRNLGDFENRRLEAAVQANLERRQLGEQFRILEPASPPIGPSEPNRPLILALGLLFGFVSGIAAGIGREALGGSLHSASEVQSALEVPVLAAIPVITFPADIRRLKRRRLLISALASLFAVVNFGAGIGGYFYVNGMPGWLLPEEAGQPAASPLPGREPEESNPVPEQEPRDAALRRDKAQRSRVLGS